MSNKERAATLLTPNHEHCQRVHNGEGGDPCMFCEYDAEAAVERLADAGLLAPDLPEPASSGWVVETPLVRKVALGHGTKVALLPQGIEFQETHITPTAARELAYALLAAANYSEDTE